MRLVFAGLAAALLAGCADSSHFIGDPLGNPFHSASNAPAPSSYDRDMAPPPPYRPSHVASIQSRPLAPPDAPRDRFAYAVPAHANPHLASDYRMPRTERTASIPAPSGHGSWSAAGGMAIVAATGDTASVLAARYNVPESALLHENGFSSAGQIRPGTRVVIPVYSATSSGGGATRIAAIEPPHRDHAARERLLSRVAAKPSRKDDHVRVAENVPERREASSKMHWVKGPAPAVELDRAHNRKAMADAQPHGRAKALARLEQKKDAQGKAAKLEAAELKKEKLAEAAEAKAAAAKSAAAARAARKMAKADAAEGAGANRKARTEQVRTAHAAPREEQAQVAAIEPSAGKKAAVDPTPTASLPPASADKPAANGAPEFRWPAHGRIIQAFKAGGNDGINIAVPDGTPVKAAESGTVAYAGNEIKGFGNLVLIRHPNGYVTAYANNGDIEVKRGEQVKRGQTIAKSGQSGNVASPQLHFELRKGSTPVDPTRYLAGL